MNIGILTRHDISFEKQFEMAKAIEKLRQLVAAQKVQFSLCAYAVVLQVKNCKNLLRVGRPEKFT